MGVDRLGGVERAGGSVGVAETCTPPQQCLKRFHFICRSLSSIVPVTAMDALFRVLRFGRKPHLLRDKLRHQ